MSDNNNNMTSTNAPRRKRANVKWDMNNTRNSNPSH
jgi:hypothetical protein